MTASTSMTPAEESINNFLVEVFHDVLRLESDSLHHSGCGDLSVSEIHLLDAVQKGAVCMGELARRLSLSPGSVTTAAKALERKGYLVRTRSEEDHRRVTVALTAPAEAALACHAEFHRQLVQAVSSKLDAARLETLGSALGTLHSFFKTYGSA